MVGGKRVLLTSSQIEDAVRRLAQEVHQQFVMTPPHVLVVLKGGFVFAADLIRLCPALYSSKVDFVQVKSYWQDRKQSEPEVVYCSTEEFYEPVLVVDDVYDTGETAEVLVNELRVKYGVECVHFCFAFAKKRPKVKSAFVGKYIAEDAFIYGYGLDSEGRWRGLPFLVTKR